MRRPRPPAPVTLALTAAVALSLLSPAPIEAAPEDGTGRLVPAWGELRFARPLGVVHGGEGTGVLYVLEQAGVVKAVAPEGQVRTFLDLSATVFPKLQGGLLGLAFHPQYVQNGRVFVTYLAETGDAAAPFQIVLSELRAQGGACSPASERILLRIPKTLALHNGGGLVFGPDRMLYVSTGDNKVQKEAINTSQNPASLLGKILRIDVDRQTAPLPYAIPADNPWAGAGAGVRPEIWAYGLRNPWRISFDAQGRLWTCDPGSTGECREVVTLVQGGGNHGWPFFEGTRPMEPIPPQLQGRVTTIPPYFEYVRTGGEGTTAAIGGYLYRGQALPALRGRYVFADFGRGMVLSIDASGAQGTDLRVVGPVPDVSSLGEDEAGELYACAIEEGVVYKLVP